MLDSSMLAFNNTNPSIILVKGMPLQVCNTNYEFFYGEYESETSDGRLCMWDKDIRDYIYIPVVDIVSVELYPQKYIAYITERR